ncbi:MAG: helix-turn-helix domain-containing protein [Betaproteobacteria bacterium]
MRPPTRNGALLYEPDLDLTRDAIASSGLNHGLMALGDNWTSAVLLGAFTGINQFDVWIDRLGIPRATLANRLARLIELGLMRRRSYGERPTRQGYRLTQAGLKLYNHVLMFWVWERRWGQRRAALPQRLVHGSCGHSFTPVLACAACHDKTALGDLTLTLEVNPVLLERAAKTSRTGRVARVDNSGMGLRVDRWSLLIVNAVILGCHHFDQLEHVLGISSSVLARRLAGMEQSGLLLCQDDNHDNRRRLYRLTPASRDLFAYLVCLSSWANRHYLHERGAIRPLHKTCGQPFVPEVLCSSCAKPVFPWDVTFTTIHPSTPISITTPKEASCPSN